MKGETSSASSHSNSKKPLCHFSLLFSVSSSFLWLCIFLYPVIQLPKSMIWLSNAFFIFANVILFDCFLWVILDLHDIVRFLSHYQIFRLCLIDEVLLSADSRFTQQELPACKPILTPGWVITALIFVGVVFIPVGLATFSASERVVEIVDRYDIECIPPDFRNGSLQYIQNNQTNKTCIRSLKVSKQMNGPVFVYYELENFYQNHRRYVKSRNNKQLRSRAFESDTTDCEPEAVTSNKAPIVPCGLIAWSLFNDTYLFSVQNKVLDISKKNIAWKSDQNHKFGSDVYPKNFQSEGLIGGAKLNSSIPLSEQIDLIVWMRTAALPTFRKLYGKLDVDLQVNDEVVVTIQNNYNTYSFEGKKKLVLSTTSWIGGKNDFLGRAYLTVGGLCLFFAVGFIVIYLVKPRPLGDPSYLSWNTNPAIF
ncbi:hypothetical protein K2173_019773 [Erythroxylum novogranatense]|uniref:ALA-interacting subunit n=1 Tax=Erythroxylum novogranatense TaxID=1862640 RepID=A0AAV8SN32_9ROSI|nr:hypothetical protein K2173_019773 [Erythroxylum novogranatense]